MIDVTIFVPGVVVDYVERGKKDYIDRCNIHWSSLVTVIVYLPPL